MSRSSKKDRILAAAVEVAERDGIRGITLESVADSVGVTKGGVQYHFGSKEELMSSVEQKIWERVEAAALASLGKPFELASASERLEAFILSTDGQGVRLGELLIILDGARDNANMVEWREFFERWTGSDVRPLTTWQRIALLATDGLWLQDAMDDAEISTDERAEVISQLIELSRR